MIGVNFWGVLRCIRGFVPRMLANGEPGHIVNTASVAGLLTRSGPYNVSKHAVVCLSEGLYKDFQARGCKLSASVLCPGLVKTQIQHGDRNRPVEFGPRTDPTNLPPMARENWERLRDGMQREGYAPAEIAERVLEAVRDDRFYVIPAQPQIVDAIRQRFDDIVAGRNPSAAAYGTQVRS